MSMSTPFSIKGFDNNLIRYKERTQGKNVYEDKSGST